MTDRIIGGSEPISQTIDHTSGDRPGGGVREQEHQQYHDDVLPHPSPSKEGTTTTTFDDDINVVALPGTNTSEVLIGGGVPGPSAAAKAVVGSSNDGSTSGGGAQGLGEGIGVSVGGSVQVGISSSGGSGNDRDDSNLLRQSANLPLAKVAQHIIDLRSLIVVTKTTMVCPPSSMEQREGSNTTTGGGTEETAATTTTTSITSTATTTTTIAQSSTAGPQQQNLPSSSSSSSPTKKLSQEEIQQIDDMADQIYYWSLAESHFPDQGSVLLECEALETLMLLVAHDRSPVILAGLRPLPTMLIHPLNRKLFLRLPNLVNSLLSPMIRFPNKVEVQEGILQCLKMIASSRAEEILHSETINAVLAAMAAHKAHPGVQLTATQFFAALLPAKRTQPEGATPLAIIFCHIDTVLEALLHAANKFPTHSEITAAVMSALATMAEFPQNAENLASTSTVQVASHALTGHMHAPLIVGDAMAVLGALCSEMVDMQKRSLVLLLKTVMSSTEHIPTLTNCCALVHSIILSYKVERRILENQFFENREKIQKHREAMDQGKIPEGTPDPVTMDTPVEVDPQQRREWFDEEFKMKNFMSGEIVPFIALGLQHFGAEDKVFCQTAEACLRSLTISKW